MTLKEDKTSARGVDQNLGLIVEIGIFKPEEVRPHKRRHRQEKNSKPKKQPKQSKPSK